MIFDFLKRKRKEPQANNEEKKHNSGQSNISLLFRKYKWYLFSSLILILLLFVVFKQIGVVLVLAALGVISRLYERFLRLEWGIELVTMAVVLATLAYSPFIGALTGIIALTVSVIVNHPMEDPKYLPISWLGLIVGAYVVSLFSSSSLFFAGIIGTVTYNLVIDPIFLMMGARFYKIAIFSVTNIAFNYFVFTTFAPTLFALVG